MARVELAHAPLVQGDPIEQQQTPPNLERLVISTAGRNGYWIGGRPRDRVSTLVKPFRPARSEQRLPKPDGALITGNRLAASRGAREPALFLQRRRKRSAGGAPHCQVIRAGIGAVCEHEPR